MDGNGNGSGNEKCAYVCGPLTELTPELQIFAKEFYESIAELCELATEKRAFVPHEHYDPKIHAKFSPSEVDQAEREQVCEKTSVLIVVPVAPSWGGGIEVEMANRSEVPVIVLCDRQKLNSKKISRLLLGNPAVRKVIAYETAMEALANLRDELHKMFPETAEIVS
jgi:hypothetical protein